MCIVLGNWEVMGSNLGLSKLTFFLLKSIFGMNVKSLKTLANL